MVNDRLEIHDVIGPDEYTEHVNNNAFTNYMARYNVEQALVLPVGWAVAMARLFIAQSIFTVSLATGSAARWRASSG